MKECIYSWNHYGYRILVVDIITVFLTPPNIYTVIPNGRKIYGLRKWGVFPRSHSWKNW